MQNVLGLDGPRRSSNVDEKRVIDKADDDVAAFDALSAISEAHQFPIRFTGFRSQSFLPGAQATRAHGAMASVSGTCGATVHNLDLVYTTIIDRVIDILLKYSEITLSQMSILSTYSQWDYIWMKCYL